MLDDLRRRLAAHGLTLTAGERTTHGYTARWRLDGLGVAAWFGTLAEVERWAARWLGDEGEGMQHDITSIELFAGIAGFSSPAIRPVAFVEKEPACHAVLRRHYPGAPILDDVRTAGAHNLPWAHVIKFGFPCQDLSVAGNRAGLAGERSGLFYEATRIVHELQPDYAVWENVPGLLSSNGGRDFAAVLMELERIGYSGCWTTLDAQFFGVAQRRQRVFGVFARRDIGAESCAEILALTSRMPGHFASGREARAGAARTAGNGAAFGGHQTGDIGETLRAGSHGAIPMVASALSASHGGADDNDAQANHIIPIDMRQASRGATMTNNRLPGSSGGAPGTGIGSNGDPSPTVAASHTPAVFAFTERTRAEGRTLEVQDDLAYALTNPGSGGRTHSRQIAGGFGVRRLTPLECERLQGFPDEWTEWGIDEAGSRVELSDSARYRMLGNAVCKKVSAWIDSQIIKQYTEAA